MKQIELGPLRLINLAAIFLFFGGAVAVLLIGGEVALLASDLVIWGGFLTALLGFDLIACWVQRKNFIEEAEERGYTAYAQELRERKF